MMALAAKQMDCFIITLDPDKHCPASSISDTLITAGFNDEKALAELAGASEVITYEFEHINADFLGQLEKEGHIIYPSSESLKIIQDKLKQKQLLARNSVPVPEHYPVSSLKEINDVSRILGFPFMLKSRFGGYDGKGNFAVRNESDISNHAWLPGSFLAERWVDYVKEVSILACRGINGELRVYPVAENIHVNSILRKTIAPADISPAVSKTAMEIAAQVMNAFSSAGMFCIEMFLTKTHNLLVNEVAPRPHNSGHFSIEACITSQFENHIRAICGLPLGNTAQLLPAVMKNILGEDGYSGTASLIGAQEALSIPGLKLHVYGKKLTRPLRKMGHLTVIADTVREAEARVDQASSAIKMISLDPA
jgi:5-(carboxyamino)imidazole ribonucleotide synthase